MVSASCPAVVIAAPASGSGKTTVATGLLGALRSAGRIYETTVNAILLTEGGYSAIADYLEN